MAYVYGDPEWQTLRSTPGLTDAEIVSNVTALSTGHCRSPLFTESYEPRTSTHRICTNTPNRKACANMHWQSRLASLLMPASSARMKTKWSVTALLHDFDYEMHPDAPDHPMKGEPILAERGVEDEIRRAILSHANYSGVPRDSPLEKTLFACDELAGFLTAVSYVKPSKSIAEVDLKSVRKKLKDKAFARSVSREDIENGRVNWASNSMSTSSSALTRCVRELRRSA